MSWGMSGMCGEIAAYLPDQLAGLQSRGIKRANLTSLSLDPEAKPTSIVKLSASELRETRRLLDEAGIHGYCVTSPVAKYGVDTPQEQIDRELAGAIAAAGALDATYIRIFSFTAAQDSTLDDSRDAIFKAFESVVTRIEADAGGALPLLENNYRMYAGDGPRTRDLLADYVPPRVALAFDAHACLVLGAKPFDEVWSHVAPWVRVLHLKDYIPASKTIVPVGKGQAQLHEIISAANPEIVHDLALEPHLINSTYGEGRDPLELFQEAHANVLDALDRAAKPHPGGLSGSNRWAPSV